MIRILRLQLRRDRVTMAIWILGTALLALASVGAIQGAYATAHDRTEVLRLALVTPSVLALRGVPNGDSAGSIQMLELFTYLAVVVGLMNTFLATRHGRADEESGRRELLAASPIGRTAPLRATLLLGVLADIVLGILLAGAFATGGADAAGALTIGAAFALTGIAFLGAGALAGELAATSRAANGIGVAVVLGAYVLRAAGDALGTPDLTHLTLRSAWPSWISPIGWGQQTLALTENRPAPLLLDVAFAVATMGVALVVHARRDLGASLLPERAGRPAASRFLRSPFGLAGRLHRPSIIGFAIGGGLLGLFTGSLAGAIGGLASNGAPEIIQTLKLIAPGGRNDLVGLFLSTIMILIGLLAAAAGVQGAIRFRQEEAEGRAELLLAAPVSRGRLLLDTILVAVIASVVVMVAAGALAFVSFLPSGDTRNAGVAFGQALVELPAALVFVGLTAAAVALVPRAAVAIGWGLYGLAIVLGLFGQLLKLPMWLVDVSPFSHVPAVPFENWGPTVILVAVDLALAAAAVLLIRRRDVST